MTKNNLAINVGSLVEALEGEHATIHIDEKVDFHEKSLPGLTHVKAKIDIMKLEDELNITAENFGTKINFVCSKCLKPFTHEIKIPFAERQFLFNRPAGAEDLDDLYLVDMKNTTIDLTELFRQEILLHFPFIPLCSLKCKGLCHICGANLNEKNCKHTLAPDIEEHKPMLHLKELFNKSSNGKTAGTKEKGSSKPNKKKI